MANVSPVRVGRRLGNCNNGLTDGGGYLNLNNEASNANWNCGLGKLLFNQYINQCHPITYTADGCNTVYPPLLVR